jgi:hypothetical protein
MASTITTDLNKIKKATSSSLAGLAQLIDYNFALLVGGLQSFLGTGGLSYDATNNTITLNTVTANQFNAITKIAVGPLAGPTLTITADGKLVGQWVSAPVVNTTQLRFNDFNNVSSIGTPGVVGTLVYVGVNNIYDDGWYGYTQTNGWVALSGSGGGPSGNNTLAGLTDVALSSLQDGQVLYFEQTLGKWTNTSFDLINVVQGFGSLTATRVPYWNGTSFVDSIISQPNSSSINVAGDFSATTKSFLIDHPSKKGWKLRYGNLEGPEHAVYVRGVGKSKKIKLPKHWRDLVDEETITVDITPFGKKMDLYVDHIDEETMTIEIGGYKSGDSYFYHVFAERKDVDKIVVEFKNKSAK